MEWTPIKDGLPKKFKSVLLYSTKKPNRCGKVFEGWFTGMKKKEPQFDGWGLLSEKDYLINVTHWRPLPSPPPQTT